MRILYFFMVLLFGATPALAAPQISVETLNYNFGDILQGEKVVYVFRFQNSGDELLEIGNVRSSCGCTAALLSAKRIQPGEVGELKAVFDSSGFKAAINKTISLDTNDPEKPQLTFSLYGNVKPELALQPERINWGRVKRGETLTAEVTIENQGAETVTLNRPHVTNPLISAELSGLQLQPGEQVELRISASLPEQKKRLSGYVIIATDYPKVPQLRVPVSARLAN